jgi:Ca2+ transporting ATPase
LTHYTYVFNIFVFLQIFNIINSRKIEAQEFNVFKDFFNNGLFIFVIILTIVCQLAIIEVGGEATKTTAFSMQQNLISIGLGFTSLIWGFILKFTPVQWWQWINLSDKPVEEDDRASIATAFKKSKLRKQSSTIRKKVDNEIKDLMTARLRAAGAAKQTAIN